MRARAGLSYVRLWRARAPCDRSSRDRACAEPPMPMGSAGTTRRARAPQRRGVQCMTLPEHDTCPCDHASPRTHRPQPPATQRFSLAPPRLPPPRAFQHVRRVLLARCRNRGKNTIARPRRGMQNVFTDLRFRGSHFHSHTTIDPAENEKQCGSRVRSAGSGSLTPNNATRRCTSSLFKVTALRANLLTWELYDDSSNSRRPSCTG